MNEAADDATIEAIAAWARQESPTSSTGGVNAMMDLVEAEVAGAGIAVERVPGKDGLGDCVILRAGPRTDAPGVLVLSHLDTVHPIGTAERDLPVRVEGERLYGPGVYDMKAGAYLALQAFKAAAGQGRASLPLVFLFTPDEEIGSPTTRSLIEDFARRSAYSLVTEPARDGGRIVTSRKGVGRFDVHVEGRPAHSGSRHPDGRSAIREAARQILAVESMTDYGRGITTSVGLVTGGTAANVIPQHCRFSVDLRVVTQADGAAFEAAILGLKPHDPDVRLTITGAMNRPSFERSEGVARLFDQARVQAAELGLDLQEVPRTGGASDGNFTAALGVPTLDGLGADGDGAHTLQEYALIPSFASCRGLMTRLLETLR